MSRGHVLFATTLICCAISFGPVSNAQDASGFKSIFDGRSLTGWKGDPNHWSVVDGAIVGTIPPGQTLNKNTWLVWDGGELGNFELKLQFRLTGAPAANSGIQYRCQVDNVDHVSGYQADLDMGATWLGRIYDEHGRALLVERGTRVRIEQDGKRHTETFAPAEQFAVLFRENDWNDYRIVAAGEDVSVYVNGTLFSQLVDRQTGERELTGKLAMQLHSGPETKIEFRSIQLRTLPDNETHPVKFKPSDPNSARNDAGTFPADEAGNALNLGFEDGTLKNWTATGDAFRGQPVRQDGIAQRWPGQVSNKQGDCFIGGFEVVQDRGTGTLTSAPFKVTRPFASFLIGGGQEASTRVEVISAKPQAGGESVIATASGANQEQMRRVAVDLSAHQGATIIVRLVDESSGGWGHLNFDDFRFHSTRPDTDVVAGEWRSIRNPVLQHLVPNPSAPNVSVPDTRSARDTSSSGPDKTIAQMYVPAGFSVDVVAAEPVLHQPVAFTIDERGRLWVVEGHSYPQKRPDGQGLDKVLILADEDGDGAFESRKVFTEGLNLVSGIEVGFGGVWIGASPELLFIPDKNRDDVPDGDPVTLLDGFGYADTHETINSFEWGPDGWLYGNQGVFNKSRIGAPGTPDDKRAPLGAGVWRYHPVNRTFEVFAHGGSNQWGLDYDDHGQFFMTHCRSYWGRGGTTHVMQGGHYWNQVNGGHAPFISGDAPDNLPFLQNFMLASAKYDHGEGGAGKPGTNVVYGGHSHVGTMVYLGDNWPAEYRNHVFTHNLHGHQINHQINLREAGGYNTVHAGSDVLFCADPQYVAVDLAYGPDGAVYITDWYDPRHCHNPNTEEWDRGNGRIYRMKYDATWKPAKADLSTWSTKQLVDAQLHPNDWYVRTARRLIQERALDGNVDQSALASLTDMALKHGDEARRLRALWSLHAAGEIKPEVVASLLKDKSELVRGWTVQLALDANAVGEDVYGQLMALASRDPSLLVRRYLASAIQRVPAPIGWQLAETLAGQPENSQDRQLQLLTWYGIAELLPADLDRAFSLAAQSKVAHVRDYIYWYAAKISEEGRARLVQLISGSSGADQVTMLGLLAAGVSEQRGLPQPAGWSAIATSLYSSPDLAIRRAAEVLGAAFGDEALLARMRGELANSATTLDERKHALNILSVSSDAANLPVFLPLLDNAQLRPQVIPLLSQFGTSQVGEALIQGLTSWSAENRTAALDVLTSRPAWGNQLLDAVAAKTIPKDLITAFYARQLLSLSNAPLTARLEKEWGTVGQSSAERQQEIETLVHVYSEAPLWAYSQQNGRNHFSKLCASCHKAGNLGEDIGPQLGGAGAKGIRYLVENVVDPNAVIGEAFQARTIALTDGRVLSGLIVKETDTALTLRLAKETVTIPRADVDEIVISKNSFMPEAQLKTLNDREQIELFKFLMTL